MLVGPTVNEWFKSIIDGRGEGRYRKDLLSPPPGHPLHTGDLEVDYGMGAMGVDRESQEAITEIRDRDGRRPVAANQHLQNQIESEYRFSQQFKSSASNSGETSNFDAGPNHWSALASACMADAGAMFCSLKAGIDSGQALGEVLAEFREPRAGWGGEVRKLQRWFKLPGGDGHAPWSSALSREDMKEVVDSFCVDVLERHDADEATVVKSFERLLKTLWDADPLAGS
jgi:hypothetical protein